MTQDPRSLALELMESLPALDIHGFRPGDIEHTVDQFLLAAEQRGDRAVKIIYGIGTGALRERTLELLAHHPLALAIQEEGGACKVLIS